LKRCRRKKKKMMKKNEAEVKVEEVASFGQIMRFIL